MTGLTKEFIERQFDFNDGIDFDLNIKVKITLENLGTLLELYREEFKFLETKDD